MPKKLPPSCTVAIMTASAFFYGYHYGYHYAINECYNSCCHCSPMYLNFNDNPTSHDILFFSPIEENNRRLDPPATHTDSVAHNPEPSKAKKGKARRRKLQHARLLRAVLGPGPS